MKLSKKDRRKLEDVLAGLKRGIAYVMDPNTALMRRRDKAGTCDAFESQFPDFKGEKWFKATKEIGNEFVIAVSAMRDLERLLNPEPMEVENDIQT